MENFKPLGIKAMDALFKNFSEEEMRTFYHQNYIQHNPHVPTGLDTVIGLLPVLKGADFGYKTHRIIQDQNLLVTHTTYTNAEVFGANTVIAFDIWRIEEGKVAEHWDAITPLASESVNGRTQVDGATEITDLEKTNENKELIKNFMSDILMGKNPGKIAEYINQEEYAQHNPQIWDGFDGLVKTIEYLVSQDNMFVYNKVHRIIGEGNFVLAQSEGAWNGKPQAFYDLFRIEDGKLVEHWDVIQEIPADMAHENGMF